MKKDRFLEDALLLTRFLISHVAHPKKALSSSMCDRCRKNLTSSASHKALKFVMSYHGFKKDGKFIKRVSGEIEDYLLFEQYGAAPFRPHSQNPRT